MMNPIRVFFGFDPREAIGAHVFMASILARASAPVHFIPLHLPTLAGYTETGRDGSNAFTYSRFLVPWLCDWTGTAIYCDGADMIVLGDIANLAAMQDMRSAVQVVKHDYVTEHPRKYVGTEMEADNRHYDRKNWSSVMLINCANYAWRKITPESIKLMDGETLHRFSWIEDDRIGALPEEWNHLVTETPPNPEAKLVHYTLGIPAFQAYARCEFSTEWFEECLSVTQGI
jgi:lipopolysaccharide biosynthesis glycosyltransferase